MKKTMKMDKTVFKIIRTADDLHETDNWLERPVEERMEAIEILRQQFIELNHLPQQMDKTVYEIVKGKAA
jgi:hypothetical protein